MGSMYTFVQNHFETLFAYPMQNIMEYTLSQNKSYNDKNFKNTCNVSVGLM